MLSEPSKSPGNRGSLIDVASLRSFQWWLRLPAYAAAKAGTVTLTGILANEGANLNITLNAIAPGYVETDMNAKFRQDEVRKKERMQRIPAGRWGTIEDFKGGPAVFLASSVSTYVSGEVLVVDEAGWVDTR